MKSLSGRNPLFPARDTPEVCFGSASISQTKQVDKTNHHAATDALVATFSIWVGIVKVPQDTNKA